MFQYFHLLHGTVIGAIMTTSVIESGTVTPDSRQKPPKHKGVHLKKKFRRYLNNGTILIHPCKQIKAFLFLKFLKIYLPYSTPHTAPVQTNPIFHKQTHNGGVRISLCVTHHLPVF